MADSDARQAEGIVEEVERKAEKRAFLNGRLEGMRAFFATVDSSIGAFTQGQSVAPQEMQNVIQFAAKQIVKRR